MGDGEERRLLLEQQGDTFESLFGQLREASAGQVGAAAKLECAIRIAVAFVSENPEQARMLLLDVVGGDPELSLPILEYHRRLAGLMREQSEGCGGPALSEVAEQALVGGAAALIGIRVAEGPEADLAGLEGELVDFLLRPYLGAG